MGTIRKRGLDIRDWGLGIGRGLLARGVQPLRITYYAILSLSAFLLFFLSSCSSTRPVAKIGLLAPFEGLHRQSGYEALTAMRAALEDNRQTHVDVLPLALDTSADPAQAQRAAQKLLQDAQVAAVVGVLTPAETVALSALREAPAPPWFLTIFPGTGKEAKAWVTALIRQMPGPSVAVAGYDPGWPDLAVASLESASGKSVSISDDLDAAQETAGVLWLGSAADGAAFLADLRRAGNLGPFWTASVGGDPVFARLLLDELQAAGLPLGPVVWCVILDDMNDLEEFQAWTAAHTPSSAAAYATYRASQKALALVAGKPLTDEQDGLAIFSLQADGSSILMKIVPFP